MITAYLTIDDAPSLDTLRKLDVLDQNGITAIWFCRGEFIERYPDAIVEIIQRGHVVGNHSYNHPYFSQLRLAKCAAQIDRTEQLIENAYQQASIDRPVKVFRFPWGDKGAGHHLEEGIPGDKADHVQAIQALLRDRNFTQLTFPGVIYPSYPDYDLVSDADTWWTFDPMEWALISKKVREGIDSVDKVLQRIDAFFTKAAESDGQSRAEIVVVHDFDATAGTFLPMLERMQENGVEFAAATIS
ncbi:MAG TPA: polysaccharide deacetylase family protein [Candidatus Lokiarchaeia archaeon]|nr:polysaccharide deacetylase family protein [Candidatus Lokiarchaeia archaeon]